MYNPLIAGGFAGAILARNSGVKAMAGGGLAFAAFSGAIELLWVLQWLYAARITKLNAFFFSAACEESLRTIHERLDLFSSLLTLTSTVSYLASCIVALPLSRRTAEQSQRTNSTVAQGYATVWLHSPLTTHIRALIDVI